MKSVVKIPCATLLGFSTKNNMLFFVLICFLGSHIHKKRHKTFWRKPNQEFAQKGIFRNSTEILSIFFYDELFQ
jgi:hypothetical protein